MIFIKKINIISLIRIYYGIHMSSPTNIRTPTTENILQDYEAAVKIATQLKSATGASAKWKWYNWTFNWFSGTTPSKLEEKLGEKLHTITTKLPSLAQNSTLSQESLSDANRAKIATHACSLEELLPEHLKTSEKTYHTMASAWGYGTPIPSLKTTLRASKTAVLENTKFVDLLDNYKNMLKDYGIDLDDLEDNQALKQKDTLFKELTENAFSKTVISNPDDKKVELISRIKDFRLQLEEQNSRSKKTCNPNNLLTEQNAVKESNLSWYKAFINTTNSSNVEKIAESAATKQDLKNNLCILLEKSPNSEILGFESENNTIEAGRGKVGTTTYRAISRLQQSPDWQKIETELNNFVSSLQEIKNTPTRENLWKNLITEIANQRNLKIMTAETVKTAITLSLLKHENNLRKTKELEEVQDIINVINDPNKNLEEKMIFLNSLETTIAKLKPQKTSEKGWFGKSYEITSYPDWESAANALTPKEEGIKDTSPISNSQQQNKEYQDTLFDLLIEKTNLTIPASGGRKLNQTHLYNALGDDEKTTPRQREKIFKNAEKIINAIYNYYTKIDTQLAKKNTGIFYKRLDILINEEKQITPSTLLILANKIKPEGMKQFT